MQNDKVTAARQVNNLKKMLRNFEDMGYRSLSTPNKYPSKLIFFPKGKYNLPENQPVLRMNGHCKMVIDGEKKYGMSIFFITSNLQYYTFMEWADKNL